MVRSCHLDTCPVGIATQQPELRAKFAGTPEMVRAYLLFVAEEARRLLASLGLRSFDEAVGRVECLRQRRSDDPAADVLDLSPLLGRSGEGPSRHTGAGPARSGDRLGILLHAQGRAAIEEPALIEPRHLITNSDRAVGARLGGAIAKRVGSGAPAGRVRVHFEGAAGQSFGAFLTAGVELHLLGRGQRLRRQGDERRPDRDRPAAGRRGRSLSPRQHRAVRRDGRQALLRRVGRRAFRGSELRRGRRRRGGRRPRVRVHDRGHGRRPGRGRPQPRRGHDRRRGLRPRSGRHARARAERRVRAPATCRTREQLAEVRALLDRHLRHTGSPRAAALLERWDERSRELVRVAPKLAEAEAVLADVEEDAASGGGK